MENSAVVFCRVSTPSQADERWSLPSQLKLCREYTRRNKLTIIKEFSVIESGWKEKEKKSFREMLRLIEAEGIKNLVVLNVERLCRDYKSYTLLNDLIEGHDLKIHFVERNEVIDKDDASDRNTFWAIEVAFARKYIRDLRKKSLRSIQYRLDYGLYPYRGEPIGYNLKKNELSPDPERAHFIKRAWEEMSTGVHSLFSLSKKLYEDGLRNKLGHKVAISTLSRMFNNPVYYGFVKNRQDGSLVKGTHEPLVGKDLYDKVQKLLLQHGYPHPQKYGKFYVYRGLMRCGYCGRVITAAKHKSHIYYHCSSPSRNHCPQLHFREERVAERFEAVLKGFHFDDRLVSWMRQMLKEVQVDHKEHHRSELKRLQDEYKRNQSRLDEIYEDRLWGRFDVEMCQKKYEEVKLRQAKIESLTNELKKNKVEYIDDGLLLLDMVQDLVGTFGRADDQHKHQLLRIIVERVMVKGEEFDFKLNEPFASLYGLKNHKGKQRYGDSNPGLMAEKTPTSKRRDQQ